VRTGILPELSGESAAYAGRPQDAAGDFAPKAAAHPKSSVGMSLVQPVKKSGL
jgi:hypothetical protein